MTEIHDPVCLRRPGLHALCPYARGARAAVEYSFRRAGVAAAMPNGRRIGSSGDLLVVELVRPRAALERMGHEPKIGIGESYMAGDWRPASGVDLAEAMVPFARQLVEPQPGVVSAVKRSLSRALPHETRNTVAQARRNIEAHYDLSNEMFATFLDETLTYSSALFDPHHAVADQSLSSAQLRKVDRILDLAGVREGTRLLEIGTGWGTLAIRAASRGASVTSLTISPSQADLARRRIEDAGVDNRVEVALSDYRQQQGRFDAVVSVEMIEAVGEEFWPDYFTAIDRCLAPGGVGVLQAILMSPERFAVARNSYGWIQKHIFPGGLIPSVEALQQACAHTELTLSAEHTFRADYAETLRRWRENFVANWDAVAELGFDLTFRRRWEFYLAYCQAGFATGAIDVGHLVLRRPA